MGVPRLAMFSGPQELAGHLAEADRILAEIPTGPPAAPELQCLLLETLSDPGPGLGQRPQGQGWGGLWRKGRGEPPTWGPAGPVGPGRRHGQRPWGPHRSRHVALRVEWNKGYQGPRGLLCFSALAPGDTTTGMSCGAGAPGTGRQAGARTLGRPLL